MKRAELERLVAECERAYPLLDEPASERFAGLVDTPALQRSQIVAERYRIVRSVRARLVRDGALSIDDTVSILRDVCDALASRASQPLVDVSDQGR